MNSQVGLSSMAFKGASLSQAIEFCNNHDFWLEFSSGLPHDPTLETTFLQANCKKLIHNYFPAPKIPFVLNLASADSEILSRTKEHVKKCLSLAALAKTPFYSIHAGFALDPEPSSLGKKLVFKPALAREAHWEIFIETLQELLPIAKSHGVQLLIENNVFALFNRVDYGNPLFCAEPQECIKLLQEIGAPREQLGLLIDVGHLSVSAKSLGFDRVSAFRDLAPYVFALHHSDNDQESDSNLSINENYWILNELNTVRSAIHILEVHAPLEPNHHENILAQTGLILNQVNS